MNVVKNKYRGRTEYVHVLAELVRAAQYRGITTYQDIAIIMGLAMKGSNMGAETGWILGEISEDEVNSLRPMLSAVAVNVKGKAGPGFFDLARQLGKLKDGEDEQAFWLNELEAVYAAWKRPIPRSEPEALHSPAQVKIAEPAILIRVNRLYRPEMTAEELYEATRGVWKLGPRRNAARYAFAVYQTVVRQVYEIHSWHPAGTTPYSTRTPEDVSLPGRWEFTGTVAATLSALYSNASVETYFPAHSQNPIAYVNC
jgi:hypothetical protein